MDGGQISGPSWLDGERFHISAKLPAATTRVQLREMLRNLLADRFALTAHLESRVVARYEFAVGGSAHKLRKPGERARPGPDADGFPKLGPPSEEPEIRTILGRTRMFLPKATLKDLAEELSFHLRRPVVDITGIEGQYDIGLYWSEEESGPSLAQAFRDQLGLRFVEKKGPVEFVVVEHIEKLPTAN